MVTYIKKVICGLNIFFFRKFKNPIMRESAIPLIENVLKVLKKIG